MVDERAVRPAQASSDWWRPTRPIATFLTGLLLAQALAQLLNPILADNASRFVQWHRALDALLDDREATAERIFREASDGTNQNWGTFVNVVMVATLVLLIVWTWRSAHNARALGRTGARLGPGWAIGAWFIPLANFVLLYLVFSDLWRSSDPASARGDGWRALPGSSLVRTWLVTYLGGTMVTLAGMALAVGGAIDESTTRSLLVTGGAVSAAGSLLTIVLVRELTARQEAIQAREPAALGPSTPRTLPASTTIDGPGWYPDPAGAYDHRYWDGTTWTEHVSRGGVTSTAPTIPPDWYPDPTGRFHWRYWTGTEWTEHVSRDQELFVDPID